MVFLFLLLIQQSLQSQDITINRSLLTSLDNDIILKQKDNIQCYDLGTQWYSGQVLHMKASCSQCGYYYSDTILLNTQVQVNVRPVIQYSGSQIHQISDTEFAVLSRTQFNVYVAEFSFYTYYFNDLIFCTIMNGNKNSVLFFYCFEGEINYIINIEYQPGLFTPISKVQIQMQNPTTMISTDQYLFMANQEQVQIYSHTSFGANLKLIKTLTYKNVQVSLKEFSYNPDPTQKIFHFHLIMIDDNNQLKIVGFVMNGDVYTESFIKMIDLKEYLKQEGHQIKDDTQFNGIQVFYENLFDDRLESKYIITTNNVNQFIMNFKYSCVAKICQEITEKVVQKELDAYGDWVAKASLAQIYKNKYIILPYQNNKQMNGAFTVYDLESAQNIVNILGGSNSYLQEQKQFMFYVYKDALKIIDSNGEMYNNFYDLNTSPTFCLNGKIRNQGLSFDLSNDFTVTRTFFNVMIRQEREPSYLWVWILIIVGVSLVVMGGIMIMKSLRKQQHTNLL